MTNNILWLIQVALNAVFILEIRSLHKELKVLGLLTEAIAEGVIKDLEA